ncbi:MAG: carbon-nitrogen hydrolase family protein [Bacteroidota bacterium]
MMKNKVKVAIVQGNPVQVDLQAALQQTLEWIEAAAGKGADLVVFGETWLTGYPVWLDYCPGMAVWDHEPTKEVFTWMHQNGVEVPGPVTDTLGALARKHQLTLVIGVNEVIRSGPGQGTMYNSLLIFNEKGELANHHRKLMPTYTEKLLHGMGDGHGLKTVDTTFGKLGALICWEHWMPLTRQALHESGEHIHIALWPKVHELHQVASRHYAFEGRCFVIAVGQIIRVKDLPEALTVSAELKDQPDRLLLNGGSCVIGPDGHYLLPPQFDQIGIIMVEIDQLDRLIGERMTLDTTGHYNRRDVFDLTINKERK